MCSCAGLSRRYFTTARTAWFVEMGEQIREILIDEQDHQIALATALGKSVPAPRTAQKE